MKDKHILLPVDVRSYKGGRLVSGEQTKYNAYGQPETAYRAETTATEIAFNLSHSQPTCGVRMMLTGYLYPRKHVRMA